MEACFFFTVITNSSCTFGVSNAVFSNCHVTFCFIFYD